MTSAILVVLVALTAPAGAVRMELGGNRSGEDPPQRLERCSGQGGACCSCGGQYGGGCVEGTEVKPCCAWARDCQSTDPLFQIGFASECNYAPYQRGLYPDEFKVEETCKTSTCSNAFADYQRAASEWVVAKGLATGRSNSKLLDSCGCGDFNLQTQQCKASNRWGAAKAAKEKRCCSRLSDCNPQDAWPRRFQELQEASETRGQEFTQCLQSCKSRVSELCVADLQRTQEAVQQSLSKEIEILGPRPGDYDRRLLEWQRKHLEVDV